MGTVNLDVCSLLHTMPVSLSAFHSSMQLMLGALGTASRRASRRLQDRSGNPSRNRGTGVRVLLSLFVE